MKSAFHSRQQLCPKIALKEPTSWAKKYQHLACSKSDPNVGSSNKPCLLRLKRESFLFERLDVFHLPLLDDFVDYP